MNYKRKFVIKVTDMFEYHWTNQMNVYIHKIYKNSTNLYSYDLTKDINNIKVWNYEKICKKNLENIKNKSEPTKAIIRNRKFEIVEITDNQTLRALKLKKINGK